MFKGAIHPFGVDSQNILYSSQGIAPAVNQAYPNGLSVSVNLFHGSSLKVGPGSHLLSLSSQGNGISVPVILKTLSS